MDDRGGGTGGGGSFVAVRRISPSIDRGNTCPSTSGDFLASLDQHCLCITIMAARSRSLNHSFVWRYAFASAYLCFLRPSFLISGVCRVDYMSEDVFQLDSA